MDSIKYVTLHDAIDYCAKINTDRDFSAMRLRQDKMKGNLNSRDVKSLTDILLRKFKRVDTTGKGRKRVFVCSKPQNEIQEQKNNYTHCGRKPLKSTHEMAKLIIKYLNGCTGKPKENILPYIASCTKLQWLRVVEYSIDNRAIDAYNELHYGDGDCVSLEKNGIELDSEMNKIFIDDIISSGEGYFITALNELRKKKLIVWSDTYGVKLYDGNNYLSSLEFSNKKREMDIPDNFDDIVTDKKRALYKEYGINGRDVILYGNRKEVKRFKEDFHAFLKSINPNIQNVISEVKVQIAGTDKSIIRYFAKYENVDPLIMREMLYDHINEKAKKEKSPMFGFGDKEKSKVESNKGEKETLKKIALIDGNYQQLIELGSNYYFIGDEDIKEIEKKEIEINEDDMPF